MSSNRLTGSSISDRKAARAAGASLLRAPRNKSHAPKNPIPARPSLAFLASTASLTTATPTTANPPDGPWPSRAGPWVRLLFVGPGTVYAELRRAGPYVRMVRELAVRTGKIRRGHCESWALPALAPAHRSPLE